MFASRFVGSHGDEVWLLVNRSPRPTPGGAVVAAPRPGPGRQYYDCYHGTALTARPSDGQTTLAVPLEGLGFGCLLGVPSEAGASGVPLRALRLFLSQMQSLTRRPLSGLSTAWAPLPQALVPAPPCPGGPPAAGMLLLPAAPAFRFATTGVEIEGAGGRFPGGAGVDFQFPWEAAPARAHARVVAVPPLWVDRFPVTNARYAAYLAATGYRPADPSRWLRRWGAPGRAYAPAPADAPVTHVSLAEARAYCAWARARLPHAWEWQYAAQGLDGRRFPWGDAPDAARAPALHTGTAWPGPEPVTAHSPAGDSPFGVADLVGNVWQYTDEFRDAHTRAVLLKGGSNYRPTGRCHVERGQVCGPGVDHDWYFPQARPLDTHGKLLLFAEAYDRSGAVGFRCVREAA